MFWQLWCLKKSRLIDIMRDYMLFCCLWRIWTRENLQMGKSLNMPKKLLKTQLFTALSPLYCYRVQHGGRSVQLILQFRSGIVWRSPDVQQGGQSVQLVLHRLRSVIIWFQVASEQFGATHHVPCLLSPSLQVLLSHLCSLYHHLSAWCYDISQSEWFEIAITFQKIANKCNILDS